MGPHGVGLPTKILNDGDICLMRVEPTSAPNADVSLYINGVLQITNYVNHGDIDLENFACGVHPGIDWGGTLWDTEEVTFELDDL